MDQIVSNGRTKLAHHSLAPQLVLLTLDCCCILVAYLVAVQIVDFGRHVSLYERLTIHFPYLVIVLILWVVTSFDQQPFGSSANVDMGTYAFHVLKLVADALVVSTVVMALFSVEGDVGRQFLLSFGVGTFLLVLALRVAMRVAVTSMRRRGFGSSRTVIVGANDRSRRLADVLQSRDYLGFQVRGYLEQDEARGKYLEEKGIPRLGNFDDLRGLIERNEIDDVFIALPLRSFYSVIQDLTEWCEQRDVPVRILADLFPLRIATNRLMYIEDIPLLSLSAVPEEQARLAAKRAVDWVVSTTLLVILAVPLALVAIAIKIDSPGGSVFFAQERVGQNQRRFKMLKFRSMVPNAEQLRPQLEELNEADGPVFKIRRDPRITRIGRFIRKYSIDEFPQLINVWLGQMSLVGPRPPIAQEVQQYTWDQRRRLSVKPGMTGLWQVSGRSDISFKEWVEMDLQYIDKWSIMNDFHILLRTFTAVIKGRGAA